MTERKDRKSNGGGLRVIYRDSLRGEVKDVPNTESQLESIWMIGKSRFSLSILHRPPKSSVPAFIEDIHHQLTFILSRNQPLYVMGDMNLHLMEPTANEVQQYCAMLHELSIDQLVTSPTRTTATTAMLIDHVLTSRPDLSADPSLSHVS